MQVTSKRSIEPATVEFSITFSEEDIALAFFQQLDPNEELFYQVFSPEWHSLPPADQLAALAHIASLAAQPRVEAAPPQPRVEAAPVVQPVRPQPSPPALRKATMP